MRTDARAIRRARPRPRRRADRGAAIVEAVAAIPVFIVVLACLIFVGKVYVAKTAVMYATKERAWTSAMDSCSGNGVSSGTIDPPSLESVGGGAVTGEVSQTLQGLPGTDTMTKSFGSVTATATRDVTPDALVGGYRKRMVATTRVMCNEEPMAGDLAGTAKAAWSALTRW